jgi:hypothetical protein
MRTTLSLLVLATALVPVPLPAQSPAPSGATIRLYEQPPGFVLGEDQRVYTIYFNSIRSRRIGVEVGLDYPAAAAASQLTVGCRMTRPDGRVVEGIWKIGLSIRAGSTRAVGANTLFGAGREGWQNGIYKVSCAGDKALGEVSFQMSPGPSLLTDMEFRLREVRFFPTSLKLMPEAQREYQDEFSASEAASIGIELSFLHPKPPRTASVPVDCYILSSIARNFGVMHADYEFEASATGGSVAMALGWDQPGQWPRGSYLAVCQIHGRPIAVERFSVR